VIPADEPATTRRSFDLPGALTVTAGATLFVYALVQGPEDGWTHGPILAALALAVLFLIAFAIVETKSRDALMPAHLFGNRNLLAGMAITFIYMGTFGALPYFVTVLFQSVQGYTALRTGLAFIVPSLAIFTGTQLGARMANRMTTRATLVAGFVVGIAGTAALAPAAYPGAPYAAIVPGLIVSGIGQGIVWTAMWIAAASGVAHHEQGIASGMASTALNVGNAIGIAVLVAYANRGIGAAQGEALRAAVAAGAAHAFWLAAAVMVLGLFVSLALPARRGAGVAVAAG
jgi:predicted MFS family arabinose efflux permease